MAKQCSYDEAKNKIMARFAESLQEAVYAKAARDQQSREQKQARQKRLKEDVPIFTKSRRLAGYTAGGAALGSLLGGKGIKGSLVGAAKGAGVGLVAAHLVNRAPKI